MVKPTHKEEFSIFFVLNTCTLLSDLPIFPVTISGGRMEQLNGKPTLIGGATPWARGNKNVKKPQIQMCMSCRKT